MECTILYCDLNNHMATIIMIDSINIIIVLSPVLM
jgi:hypothetical protein